MKNNHAEASAKGLACIITSKVLISSLGLFFASTGTRSIASSVESCPSITRPKIVYLLSRCACFEYVMKNCDLQHEQ